MDDDANGWPDAGLSGREFIVYEGEVYYLVVATYSDLNQFGTYTLRLSDNLTHIHTLKDAITALQVTAGLSPPGSHLAPLSDSKENGMITLGTAITALRDVASGL